MESKDEKVVNIKKDEPKEPVVKKEETKQLTMSEGAKLINIAAQKDHLVGVINSLGLTLNNLIQKEKGLLEAYDLPIDIELDEKTFKVTYTKGK